MTHNGKCPCGCGREVPNNHLYATKQCGKRYRWRMSVIGGDTRPVLTGRTRLEKKQTRREYFAEMAGD